jgi:hypothetical protein
MKRKIVPRILVEHPLGKGHLEDQEEDGRETFKRMLWKWIVMMESGWKWFGIVPNGRPWY